MENSFFSQFIVFPSKSQQFHEFPADKTYFNAEIAIQSEWIPENLFFFFCAAHCQFIRLLDSIFADFCRI